MDITEAQRMQHLLRAAGPPTSAPALPPGLGLLWKVTTDHGDGTWTVTQVYDNATLGNVTRRVYPVPGETLQVGDYGIVVARGDGQWLFFCRREVAPNLTEIGISGNQRVRVVGTDITGYEDHMVWRIRKLDGTEHGCGRIYRFSEPQTLAADARLWVFGGNMWRLLGYFRCTTDPPAGCTLECITELYLITDPFEIVGSEMSSSTWGALGKLSAVNYAHGWWDAEDYYDGSTYYISWGNAQELSAADWLKFSHKSDVVGQTVYGIAFMPSAFLIDTGGATLHSASLSYLFYASVGSADPSRVSCYLTSI